MYSNTIRAKFDALMIPPQLGDCPMSESAYWRRADACMLCQVHAENVEACGQHKLSCSSLSVDLQISKKAFRFG